MSLIDRAIRSSSRVALRMQPRRVDKVANEMLYSSPSKREEVAEIRRVGTLMVNAGLTPPGLGKIAVRSAGGVTVTQGPLDQVDARNLEAGRGGGLVSDAARTVGAALLAFPAAILSTSSPAEIEPLSVLVGSIRSSDQMTDSGVYLTSQGVVSAAPTLAEALDRLMAAELLAQVGLNRKDPT